MLLILEDVAVYPQLRWRTSRWDGAEHVLSLAPVTLRDRPPPSSLQCMAFMLLESLSTDTDGHADLPEGLCGST